MVEGAGAVLMDGFVAPGFESVRDQFAAHLRSGEEGGAAFCVTLEEEVVVDLWGGYRDVARTDPWQRDTAALMFSVTKGLAALAMLQLHEAGHFSYDAPVAEYWPEFAQCGKGDITIRTLMNHRAGLAAIDQVFTMEEAIDPANYDRVAWVLARQLPLWKPEEGQAYHATTFGMYVGELFRRFAKQGFSDYFQEHIAGPLDAQVAVGVPLDSDWDIAEIEAPTTLDRLRGMLPHIIKGGTAEGNVGRSFFTGGLSKKAMLNPKLVGGGPELYNRPEVRCHPILWGGGIGTARGLAKIFGALANGGSLGGHRLVEEASLLPVHKRQGWSELDGVLGKPVGWSQGFLKEAGGMFSPSEESFGHAGLGGALGWADPLERYSVGYITNKLDWRIRSPRCLRLCKAVADAVNARS